MAAAALPFSPRRPFSSPCFLLCFLLGFVAGLFPFAHRHLLLDLRHLPLPEDTPPALVRVPTAAAEAAREPPTLIIVTPTRARPLQAYHLHRLAHTLRLVPAPLLWLVVERGAATRETAALLRGCGVMYRHLASPDGDARRGPGRPAERPRETAALLRGCGVMYRHLASPDGDARRGPGRDHIEQHSIHGLVYFADEDNVYSLDLFQQLRAIRSFGTWPVAMLGVGKSKTLLERPVCDDSRVVGWHTNERNSRSRRFHVNTSGFAFNSSMLWDADKRAHQAWNYIRLLDTVREGFQETTFIEQLVEDETQMEGIPADCSKIMNFNLHLEDKHLVYPKGWQMTENLDVIIPI
ncbi:putative glucuronosyltransferase [Panicum miliaceum]|uniref:Glycosyltransferases n=1 Tax=Panicum miliaceum TaxID=4540 RepID=A0A3L6SJF0_PANMI|nr:putative glucuronosyltransferase [Panicum miliaceum]